LFWPDNLRTLRPKGGFIHYYSFQHGLDALEKAEEELRRIVEETGRRVVNVEASRLVRETTPSMWQTVIDAQVR